MLALSLVAVVAVVALGGGETDLTRPGPPVPDPRPAAADPTLDPPVPDLAHAPPAAPRPEVRLDELRIH